MDIYEQLWNAFNDIFFDEKPHKYTDSVGTDYTSVTTFVGQFESDKDWDYIAERSAIKKLTADGINVDLSKIRSAKRKAEVKKLITETAKKLRAEWNHSGDIACSLGTMVHAVAELGWQNKEFYPDDREFEKYPEIKEDFDYRKQKLKKMMTDMRKIYMPIKNELIVYDRGWKLCGTIDFLAKDIRDGSYAIIDWKTNKKWEFSNRYNKLKAPFDKLDDCNISHYELQLNIYKAILEKHTDIKIKDLILIHIPPKEVGMAEVHKCQDLQKILIPYLNKMEKQNESRTNTAK